MDATPAERINKSIELLKFYNAQADNELGRLSQYINDIEKLPGSEESLKEADDTANKIISYIATIMEYIKEYSELSKAPNLKSLGTIQKNVDSIGQNMVIINSLVNNIEIDSLLLKQKQKYKTSPATVTTVPPEGTLLNITRLRTAKPIYKPLPLGVPPLGVPPLGAPPLEARKPPLAPMVLGRGRAPPSALLASPLAQRPITRGTGTATAAVAEGSSGSMNPNQEYFGDRAFINSCMDAFKVNLLQGIKGKSGSFGTTLNVVVGTERFFVKRIINTPYSFLKKEIDFAVYLTSVIPNYVSNLKGAYIDKSVPVAFLIYEGPEGMVLNEFIERNPPNPVVQKKNEIYSKLYCLIVAAKDAMKRSGIVHRDIKPANMYIVTDRLGNPLTCKLFDFGLSDRIGDPFIPQGSPRYTPIEMRNAINRPHTVRAYSGTVSSFHNDYSVDVIWDLDFKMAGRPKPSCRSFLGGGPSGGGPAGGGPAGGGPAGGGPSGGGSSSGSSSGYSRVYSSGSNNGSSDGYSTGSNGGRRRYKKTHKNRKNKSRINPKKTRKTK